MEILLFAAYLFLFAWLVTRIKFFTQSGLTPALLITVFLLKVIVGISYGWIGIYYNQLDTWAFHFESLKEKGLLLSDPVDFVASLFRSGYTESQYGKFLSVENSWWNDLDGNFFIKMLAVFNVFSSSNYYINVVFYSFLTLAGPIALYRVMTDLFPTKKLTILLSTFLLPSFMYWTSGIHKDGLIFAGIAVIIYCFHFGIQQNSFSFKKLISIGVSLLLVLLLRNFLVPILIPAIIAWILAWKQEQRSVLTFGAVYFVCMLLFFSAKYIYPSLDFPQSLVDRQQAFLSLKGNSAVEVSHLQASAGSFFKNAPQAYLLSTIRPYPSDVKDIFSLGAALEIDLLILLFFVFLFIREPRVRLSPTLLVCLFFSFSVLMSIGYTVHFIGAIVRYRSLVLPFLVVPMMASINWKRIQQLLPNNITNENNV
ncbi:hypothetical protein OCK74_05865 [Chitinophagaceae bacterium LB-8]|uniref:Uncharacterized protein n=1 Tax=Paraflavisolibacter caeni TaxID=2982496 RepID=A0A9X3BHA7_9BACT|nr:hypothetical protein [Paraflavisolibacter caeni]MCU7548633.1 hypothetical protein [Paraflavisolibacter caeni]